LHGLEEGEDGVAEAKRKGRSHILFLAFVLHPKPVMKVAGNIKS
jgi:hypothetical protein